MDAWCSRLSNGAENRLGEEDFVAGERSIRRAAGDVANEKNKLIGINEQIGRLGKRVLYHMCRAPCLPIGDASKNSPYCPLQSQSFVIFSPAVHPSFLLPALRVLVVALVDPLW